MIQASRKKYLKDKTETDLFYIFLAFAKI